jgi:hypothetical protein
MAALYRVLWFFLMVLVMAPAFIFAGSIDGITYGEALGVTNHYMDSMLPFPDAMAEFLTPAVTFFGQHLPASSSVAVLAGEMLWEHIGVILTFGFFSLVQPPFYKEVQKKYGEVDSTQYVGGLRAMPFYRAAGILITFWIVMEVIFGFVRNPLADRWTGSVELVTLSKTKKLDATMTFEMVDPGFVMDRRPDVRTPGVRITYDGPDADILRKMKINEELFAKPERWKFTDGFCKLRVETNSGWNFSSYLGGPSLHMYKLRYMTEPKDPCDTFELGVVGFGDLDFKIIRPGQGQYSMSGENLKDVVHVSLKRDSRVSFIQRIAMRIRFPWWDDKPTFQKG